jgi:hypothetical protein
VSPPPPPPNSPPVAVAGGPYTSENGVVNFDGSASSDPEGDALSFLWTFGDGTTSTQVKPSHTYAQDGSFNVGLTVTDAKGLPSSPSNTTAAISRAVTFVGAGNVASSGDNDARTATLLDNIPGTVFTIGDNAFPDGSDDNYAAYYRPTWGRHLNRTRPVLGNHDYQTGNADGSFKYFGDRFLGGPGLGYYSYNVGAWHVIVLNDRGSGAIDDAQMAWLASDLDASKDKRCTVALWHIPLFQSSNSGGTTNSIHRPLWDALYSAGVDVVLNAQPHHYERMKPMAPNGSVDQARGIREFIVGTGGGDGVLMPTSTIFANSEARGADFGVLKFTLRADSYDWEFVPVAGASFRDSGTGSCH